MTVQICSQEAQEAVQIAEIFTEITEKEYCSSLEENLMFQILDLEEE